MEIWIWIGFIAFIFILLALDLGIFHKNPHLITFQEALGWTSIWIVISLLFNVFIYFAYENHWLGIGKYIGVNTTGNEAGLNFLTSYLIEKSLSVDNIFVIALIFSFFNTPLKFQHKILYWGILGALFFRGVMIVIGTALINNFSWITYLFGALLLYSAFKLFKSEEESVEPDKNPFIRQIRKFFPVNNDTEEGKFFTPVNGVWAVTPLLIVLVVIETTDIMFAVDSIPAIFAVTTDPFLVFTSNVFAILGLRSLYFVLASMLDKFQYLRISLVFILAFVAIKMLLIHFYKFPTFISLVIITATLAIGVIVSLIRNKSDNENQPQEEKNEEKMVNQI